MVRLSWLAALLAGGVLLVTGVYRLRQRRLPSEPGGLIIVRCPLHGIAHDAERETCPSCAKAQPPDRPAGTSIAASGGPSRTVGQVVDDASITAAVKTKLASEKLSTVTKIDVDTRNGIVTLTGNVDSEVRRQRVVEIAGQVQGVRDVVSNLRVGS